MYLWKHSEYWYSDIHIVDWNPETKVLVIESYNNKISKLTHGIDVVL